MENYETLQEQKEADFLSVYDKFVADNRKNGIVYKHNDVCKIIASMPAPRFYVLPHVAMQRINEFRYRGIMQKKDSSRRMYGEIYRRFVALKNQYGDSVCNYNIIESVVEQEAPCWYLEPTSARDLYYNAMKRRRERARRC